MIAIGAANNNKHNKLKYRYAALFVYFSVALIIWLCVREEEDHDEEVDIEQVLSILSFAGGAFLFFWFGQWIVGTGDITTKKKTKNDDIENGMRNSSEKDKNQAPEEKEATKGSNKRTLSVFLFCVFGTIWFYALIILQDADSLIDGGRLSVPMLCIFIVSLGQYMTRRLIRLSRNQQQSESNHSSNEYYQRHMRLGFEEAVRTAAAQIQNENKDANVDDCNLVPDCVFWRLLKPDDGEDDVEAPRINSKRPTLQEPLLPLQAFSASYKVQLKENTIVDVRTREVLNGSSRSHDGQPDVMEQPSLASLHFLPIETKPENNNNGTCRGWKIQGTRKTRRAANSTTSTAMESSSSLMLPSGNTSENGQATNANHPLTGADVEHDLVESGQSSSTALRSSTSTPADGASNSSNSNNNSSGFCVIREGFVCAKTHKAYWVEQEGTSGGGGHNMSDSNGAATNTTKGSVTPTMILISGQFQTKGNGNHVPFSFTGEWLSLDGRRGRFADFECTSTNTAVETAVPLCFE